MKNKYALALTILFAMAFSACQNKSAENKIVIKPNGNYEEYDTNGKKVVAGFLLDNKKHGIWMFYKNDTLTEVKQFQNDSLLYTLEKSDFEYKVVQLKKINSYIPIPKNWETTLEHENKQVLLSAVKKCLDSDMYCPNIVVGVNEVVGTFEGYIDNYDDELTIEYGNNIKFLTVSKNNHHADSYNIEYTILQNGVKVTFLTTLIKSGNKIITIFCSSNEQDYDKNILLFKQITNSFKINEAA